MSLMSKDGRPIDFTAAQKPARQIVKILDDAAFTAPEAVPEWNRKLLRIAELMNELAKALAIDHVSDRQKATGNPIGEIRAEIRARVETYFAARNAFNEAEDALLDYTNDGVREPPKEIREQFNACLEPLAKAERDLIASVGANLTPEGFTP